DAAEPVASAGPRAGVRRQGRPRRCAADRRQVLAARMALFRSELPARSAPAVRPGAAGADHSARPDAGRRPGHRGRIALKRDHSALMPAALMTSLHLWVSSAMNVFISAGDTSLVPTCSLA